MSASDSNQKRNVRRGAKGRIWFQHPAALVESSDIGAGTRIWAFAHILKRVVIGKGCNIGDHCYVESGAVIGDDVTIKNGVAIWRGVTIENNVFVAPNVVFTNDLYPRSRSKDWTLQPTLLRHGVTVGANSTLLCGITVGEYAMIGAGSVVTKDIPAYALAYGNPARVHGYICRCRAKLNMHGRMAKCPACRIVYAKRAAGLALAT